MSKETKNVVKISVLVTAAQDPMLQKTNGALDAASVGKSLRFATLAATLEALRAGRRRCRSTRALFALVHA